MMFQADSHDIAFAQMHKCVARFSAIADFYRATLCVSAVFAVARPFVRPSIMLVHCIQTAEVIVKFFIGPVPPSF